MNITGTISPEQVLEIVKLALLRQGICPTNLTHQVRYSHIDEAAEYSGVAFQMETTPHEAD